VGVGNKKSFYEVATYFSVRIVLLVTKFVPRRERAPEGRGK